MNKLATNTILIEKYVTIMTAACLCSNIKQYFRLLGNLVFTKVFI